MGTANDQSWISLGGRGTEFALVGEDSPIARSGRFFDLLLLDENAGSHVALGEAFAYALEGSEDMTPEEQDEVGFNSSGIHMDVPFGNSDVTVVATESRQGEVLLLEQGCWTKRFLNPEI